MKRRFASGIAAILLLASVATGEVNVKPSPIADASDAAAANLSAAHAYIEWDGARAYCLIEDAEGARLVLADTSANTQTELKRLPGDMSYAAIAADSQGDVYLLARHTDETKKSKLLCLPAGDGYATGQEFVFPGASGNLFPLTMEFSSQSQCGYALLQIESGAQNAPAMCAFNAFWGALEGYDQFIVIQPGKLEAVTYQMSDCFDAYGYPNDKMDEYISGITSGDMLAPNAASLSPYGDVLLIRVEYSGVQLIYVMDMYSQALELIYLPDNFSGSVGWTEAGTLMATPDDGTGEFTVPLAGFLSVEDGEWGQPFEGGWYDGNGEDESDSWNDVEWGDIDDWT